jgi:DNA-binding transcriptional ArsR family regulator
MAMKQTYVDHADALGATAALFHGFADRSRLALLTHLALGEHRVVDLTAHLGLAQSTVSKHLACLLDLGLVTVRAEGRASVYALARPAATRDLLSLAEALLPATHPADPSVVQQHSRRVAARVTGHR